MNKKIRVVTTTIALCLGLIIAGTKVYATTGKALNDTTRIREKATTDSKVVTILDKGEKVEVLSEENNWYKVQYKTSKGKEIGYVRNDLLEVEEAKKETKTEQKSQEQSQETKQNEENSNNDANNNSNDNSKNESDENQNSDNNKNNEEAKQEDNTENATTAVIEENAQIKLQNDTEVQLLPVIFSCKTGKITVNENVTITEVVGNWCHIEAEDLEGWVLTSKIENSISDESQNKTQEQEVTKLEEKQEEAKKEEKKEETKTEEENKTESIERKLYVSTLTLNLREKANTTSKVVTQLNQNDEVTVIEVVDDTWSKVKVNGHVGYTASQYLSKKKTSDVTSRGSQEIRSSEESKTENKNKVAKKEENNNQKAEATTTNKVAENTSTDNSSWKVANTSSEKKEQASSKKEEKKETKTKSEEKSTTKKKEKKTTSTSGSAVVAYAKKYLGTKYVYGATGPNAFDCSGFTSYVYRHFGYSLDRTSSAQRSNGTAVSKSDKQPGDLLCFSGHVGIYIGGNKFIHASHPGDTVKISSLSGYYTTKKPVLAVRRIVK